MTAKSEFETFYVQSIASERDCGAIFLPHERYVNPIVLNEILEANNPFPCNATGKMEIWTTNLNLQAKSEYECVNFVSEDDLKEWECETLFDSLVEGEYAGIGDSWNPRFLSVTWSDGDQEDVEEAISNHLEAAHSG